MRNVQRFLDKDGIIKIWPSKKDARMEVLQYLSTKFECGRDYTEKEINNIIDQNHSFNDHFLLRRALIDYGFLRRMRDGSKYWKEVKE